jgi:hypothetical protein
MDVNHLGSDYPTSRGPRVQNPRRRRAICAGRVSHPAQGAPPSERRYTIVVSRPADRPRNARAACGVQWLNWGRQTAVPEQPGYGLLLVRNMLASPVFAHAVQNVSELGTERQVMGPYHPSPTYTSRRAFERLGCAR